MFMSQSIQQQILISGVGGQGVLFITRLLAETAIIRELPVITSETHGMAQRGGTVISHVKVGKFSSPLIRPLAADGLLVMKAENLSLHGPYVKNGGWIVVNSDADIKLLRDRSVFRVGADQLARKIGSIKSTNLILLGFALAKTSELPGNKGLFCSFEDIRHTMKSRMADNKKLFAASIKAIETGYDARI
jgi:indolepyruvate ferredoxin oxidoreductase beta subunit